MTTTENTKPKEILELEQELGVELIDITNEDLEKFNIRVVKNCFAFDGHYSILKLESCNLKNIDFLNKFTSLEELYLKGNSIVDISILSSLKKLKVLDLNYNKVGNIKPLSCLENLNTLYLESNPISNTQKISLPLNIEYLDISYLKLNDIYFLKNLSQLKYLFAHNNNIDDISPLINKPLLFILLFGNRIKYVPSSIASKFNWLENQIKFFNQIELYDNPLEFPPNSVIEQGAAVVQSYYEDAEKYGHKALSEGRIIFIGDGASGKSSIIEKTLYGTFAKGRTQTNGIKIEHFSLQHPTDSRDLSFHIWDFGGQEIQHAVHKFFFTEGCLYVLVLDNRKEEDPEYWLQQIESLGGNAKVLVVFNKQDENTVETVDRKYLKEKYPNIVNFYNTSCVNDFGITDFKKAMEIEAVQLRTVAEQFPNNWLNIKTAIEEHTQGNTHYLTFEVYREICKQNGIANENTQKLLLRYFNTIGAVTWFGDDVNLNIWHVLKPEWITQGVYKIITSKKTATLKGQINVSDFIELLQPLTKEDYTYNEAHYGFILSMMKKFDLCYTSDDKSLLIPSAFGKIPKVEYKEYKGEGIRTYYLQFKDYMPLALIHRFITRNMQYAVDSNFWYTGIVINDAPTNVVTMVHADKEAKRVYIKIKGAKPLGAWEHIRRVLAEIIKNYAKLVFEEMVLLDEETESSVSYNELLGHLSANKPLYFNSRLRKDFNVGYLMGLFENKDDTIKKMLDEELILNEREGKPIENLRPQIIQILQNNSQQVNTNIAVQIYIDIDIKVINETSNELQGDLNYLLGILDEQNKATIDTLKDLLGFAKDAQAAKNSGDVVNKGWKRKLKSVVESFAKGAETIKKVKEGGETFYAIAKGIKDLAYHFKINNISDIIDRLK